MWVWPYYCLCLFVTPQVKKLMKQEVGLETLRISSVLNAPCGGNSTYELAPYVPPLLNMGRHSSVPKPAPVEQI